MGLCTAILIACSGAPVQREVGSQPVPLQGVALSMSVSPVSVNADTGNGAPTDHGESASVIKTDAMPWERHAVLTIHWPKRAVQVIPSNTENIFFQVSYEGGTKEVIATASITRPPDAATSSVYLPESKDTYLPTNRSWMVFLAQARDSQNRVLAEGYAHTQGPMRNEILAVTLTLKLATPAPTPTPTPAPTPTPTPTPAPLFTQVDGVPGLEVLSTTLRLYPGDSGVNYENNARKMIGIARSQEGDVRLVIDGINLVGISKILGCSPYGTVRCETVCNLSEHEAIFKISPSGDSLEFVEAVKAHNSSDYWGGCKVYSEWNTVDFFSVWSTHSSNVLLESVSKANGTMAIKAGTIPSGETSLPIPEYFSDYRFESPRMADTSTALWYVSWGIQGMNLLSEDSWLQRPMDNLAIARWQFSTKQWIKTVPQNKVLQYFSNSSGNLNQGCDEGGSCAVSYKIRYVIHSTSDGKFYFLVWDTGIARKYNTHPYRLYRASESALTGL